MKLNFLNGYKSIIGAALAIVAGVLQGLGVITPELTGTILVVAGGIFGTGIAGKMEKIKNALAETVILPSKSDDDS